MLPQANFTVIVVFGRLVVFLPDLTEQLAVRVAVEPFADFRAVMTWVAPS